MSFIFISYSHKNGDYANRLADSLEAKGLSVWIDERIDYGARWPQAIQENLDRCNALVVVMTPESFESMWVQNELARAQRLSKPIYPLLLEGDVWLALEATQYVDVRGAKLPPASFYNQLAAVLSRDKPKAASITTRWERLQTELSELQRRYENLTNRIAAVDTDLRRVMDSEHKLTLEDRRTELASRRDEVSTRMAQIEQGLAEEGRRVELASKRDIVSPLTAHSVRKNVEEDHRAERASKRDIASARLAQIEQVKAEEEVRARAAQAKTSSFGASQVEPRRGAAPVQKYSPQSSGGTGCCLFTVLVFLGPRAGILVWWLLQTARWQAAFQNFLWPLLGFIFVPWTTMMYVLVFPGGITGFDWVWLGLGLFADIAWWAGGAARRRVPGYTGQY